MENEIASLFLLTDIILDIDEFTEDTKISYEVWALGYDEDITEVELLLGTFEDPDDAIQYASIIQKTDIEEFIREEQLDEYLLDSLQYLSIEVETVVDNDDEMTNASTIYTRNIYLKTEEDITITRKDYEVLEDGGIKVSKKLLKDFNKNDTIKVLFDDEADRPILTYKIISTVIYEDGEYYHLDFMY